MIALCRNIYIQIDSRMENMSNSQFSLFLELLLEHFWLGELVDSAQFCGGWLYLCLCIHRNNALFFVFFKCMFASFVVTW
jgi:hypothetical protein